MANIISFDINNNRKLQLIQRKHDDTILCTTEDHAPIDENSSADFIPACDMIMLINLYRYIKGNDIQNDFINPNGKNKDI